MNNLASFTLSVLMAYTVYAQSPVNWPNYTPSLSSPYYYHNQVLLTQQNAPVLQQNSDQFVLHRDAMMSVVLQQLKETTKRLEETSKRLYETNIVVENVKNEMTDLKNEVSQLKKSAEERDKADRLKNESNETTAQTEMITTEFEAFTFNSSKDGEIPTARFCGCSAILYVIDRLTKDLDDTKFKLEGLTTQFKVSISPTTIDKEPTSCADLKELGYAKSGIFSVKGTNQVENVYCDFTKPNSPTYFQKLIGIVDVKTTRVSFHAQRESSYAVTGTAIPFDLLLTNEGTAMTKSTGIFVAPTPGTYFFAYSGISEGGKNVRVDLEMKTKGTSAWVKITQAYGSTGIFETSAFQATLLLRKDDEIRLYLTEGTVYENIQHFTNFVGFLLEEELV